jgi:hypothetical protein
MLIGLLGKIGFSPNERGSSIYQPDRMPLQTTNTAS